MSPAAARRPYLRGSTRRRRRGRKWRQGAKRDVLRGWEGKRNKRQGLCYTIAPRLAVRPTRSALVPLLGSRYPVGLTARASDVKPKVGSAATRK